MEGEVRPNLYHSPHQMKTNRSLSWHALQSVSCVLKKVSSNTAVVVQHVDKQNMWYYEIEYARNVSKYTGKYNIWK